MMYDQPILSAYENALQLTGSPQLISVNVNPTSAGAPAFPGNLASTPPGFVLPTQSIVTVDPAFQVAKTWQNNVQIERAVGQNHTMTVGYVFAKQSQLPTVNDINLINPTGQLADGRPIFSTAVNASTRLDPRFNHIYTVQSIGSGHYNALSLTLNRRWATGVTYNLSYTLGKGIDNAPINNAIPGGAGLSVNGDDPRSDPTSLDRDKGPNLLDIRHNFNGSIVYNPTVNVAERVGARHLEPQPDWRAAAVQQRAAVQHPREPGLERRRSGQQRSAAVRRPQSDVPAESLQRRPALLALHSARSPGADVRGEVIGEFKNIFNTDQTLSVATATVAAVVVPTDAAGNPLSAAAGRRVRVHTDGGIRAARVPARIPLQVLVSLRPQGSARARITAARLRLKVYGAGSRYHAIRLTRSGRTGQ